MPWSFVILSTQPQCGQIGPVGQRIASMCAGFLGIGVDPVRNVHSGNRATTRRLPHCASRCASRDRALSTWSIAANPEGRTENPIHHWQALLRILSVPLDGRLHRGRSPAQVRACCARGTGWHHVRCQRRNREPVRCGRRNPVLRPGVQPPQQRALGRAFMRQPEKQLKLPAFQTECGGPGVDWCSSLDMAAHHTRVDRHGPRPNAEGPFLGPV